MPSRRLLPTRRIRSLSSILSTHPGTLPMRPSLGCVVSRRISDDAGRGWRVREFRAAGGLALFFQCQVSGVRPEVRSVPAPLESLTDDELVVALQAQMVAE